MELIRRGAVVVAAAFLAVALPATVVGAAAPVPAPPKAQAALSRTALHYARGHRAIAASPRASLGAMHAGVSTKAIGDPAGDDGSGFDPRGDLLAVAVAHGSSTLVVGAATAAFEDPTTSYNWQGYQLGDPAFVYGTGFEWSLDVNGDGADDYHVFFIGDGSGVYADVTPASDVSKTLCRATPSWDADSDYYAAFPAACIGNPAQVRASVFMIYETPSTLSEDATGWTAAATRPRPPTALASHKTFNCTIRSKANHKYVTAEVADRGAAKGRLRARSDTVGSSRQYQCVAIGTDQWAIKSRATHKFVRFEPGAHKGMLRAASPKIGAREKFAFKTVSKCSCFAIKAGNRRFVSAHVSFKAANYGLLRAGGGSVGTTEEFEIRAG